MADADVVLSVQPPSVDALVRMKPGAVLLSFIYAHKEPAVAVLLRDRPGSLSFAMGGTATAVRPGRRHPDQGDHGEQYSGPASELAGAFQGGAFSVATAVRRRTACGPLDPRRQHHGLLVAGNSVFPPALDEAQTPPIMP